MSDNMSDNEYESFEYESLEVAHNDDFLDGGELEFELIPEKILAHGVTSVTNSVTNSVTDFKRPLKVILIRWKNRGQEHESWEPLEGDLMSLDITRAYFRDINMLFFLESAIESAFESSSVFEPFESVLVSRVEVRTN